ncbi:3'-5' exonuclease [candidate division KSB1 bacterium]|nr:3'-5' exonuclease [candidate division KSB1 bacterium]
MIIVFDTETTGLPKNWNAPVTDTENWPRMIQIAWVIYDKTGKQLEAKDYIIRPEGFNIPKDAEQIHGISTERALFEGHDLYIVLKEFLDAVERCDYLVAHNISFDEKIVGAEIIRTKIKYARNPNIQRICTKEASTDYCKLPGPYGYKWPSLAELHRKLFGNDFKEAHQAEVDVQATGKCFWELVRLGVIELD